MSEYFEPRTVGPFAVNGEAVPVARKAPVTAVMPGQAERAELEDAVREIVSRDCVDDDCPRCNRQTTRFMKFADAYAQAAIAAQQPQPAPELAGLNKRVASLYRLVDDILTCLKAGYLPGRITPRHVEEWEKRADDA